MTTIQIKVPNWLDRIFIWPVMWYRKRKYGHSFRKIYLGEGEFTIVEPQDYYRFGNFNWFLDGSEINLYAARNMKNEAGKIKTVRLHREIMEHPDGLLVDHRNGNSLDNRRENLRLATQSQNRCNTRINKDGCTSKFRGVCWCRKAKKWEVNVRFKGKRVFSGKFDEELQAAHAYDEAAKKYHGEFARLNFPD